MNWKLILPLLCLSYLLNAQDIEYAKYNWENNPELHQLEGSDTLLDEVIIKQKKVLEYVTSESDGLKEYELFHTIIRVNSHEAVERNNRVYLPLYNIDEIITNKARVITSTGKIIELDQSNIHEAQDEASKMSFKYYAMEGIDVGSEIEYIYLTKGPSYALNGATEKLQSDILTLDLDFEIISDKNLFFATKAINGLPQLPLDTTITDKNKWSVHVDRMNIAKEEDYVTYESGLQAVHYKLDYNISRGTDPVINYSDIAQNVYAKFYPGEDKSLNKTIKKYIKAKKFASINNQSKLIRAIEDTLKGSIRIFDNQLPELGEITTILEKGYCNDVGMTKFMLAIYDYMDVKTALVFTTNRYKNKFDPEFESAHFLRENMIYFPDQDKFIAPGVIQSRLGYIPHQWTNNYGLFIKQIEVAGFKTVVANIKFIEPLEYNETGEITEVSIDFSESLSTPSIHLKRTLSGYYAQSYQPYYDFVPKDQIKEIDKQLITFFNQNIEVEDVQVENTGMANFGIKPIIASSTVTTNVFTEKAGPKYIFKIGEVIGPQMEMYQKEERQNDIENSYNRQYIRKLEFTIPEGYKASNLEALKFNIFHEEEGEKTMGFISDYKREGNKVFIEIDEFYKNIVYPREQFENFRKVINAAADFNKVVVFLEKE